MNYEIREEPNSLDPSIIMRSCYSKIDGGYIGLEETAELLEKRGIAPQKSETSDNVCSIGFCEKEQKWYGWSHRAIFGFGVGSKVGPGQCGYVADTPEGLIDDRANFFSDISPESAAQHRAECQILPDRSGIRILHTPINLPVAKDLKHLAEIVAGDVPEPESEMIFEDAVSIQKCGHGTWTAKTLDDAKQMAMDFAEGVS